MDIKVILDAIGNINSRLAEMQNEINNLKILAISNDGSNASDIKSAAESVSSTQDAMCEQTTRSADKVSEMESSICELTEMVGKLQSSSTTATS